jgi:hypothetical protein
MRKKQVAATVTKCHLCGAQLEMEPQRYPYLITDNDLAQMQYTLRAAKERYDANRVLTMHNCDSIGRIWGHFQFGGIRICGIVEE